MTAPQLAPGAVVGNKYSVVAPLGFGGSSATYHAVGSDGREVALKLFDPGIRQRADIMAALEQTYAGTNALPPDVAVPLLDAGYDAATGAPFSVTEKITFPTLAQVAATRPMTPEEVGSLLTFIARAVDAGHARQLFHHALKPTNIFVGFNQGFGIRVTDFGAGLARAAVPTQEGYALSAPWLAPEQVQGGAAAGAAADVFAAALLAFYALTGRSYWLSCQGPPDLANWQREIQSPRTPASVRARELGAVVSSGFDGVLGASLAVDPAQRYRSVGELAAAIESLVAVKGPETAATMAFPAMSLGLGGDYPPPPPPMGGMAQPGPAAGSPAIPPPAPLPPQPTLASAQSQQNPQMPQQQGQQGNAYMAMQQSQQPAPGASDAGRRQTMEVSAMRRQSSNKLVPILVGVAALVLAGGGVAAFIVMGKHSQPTTEIVPASSGSAAPSGGPSAGPADSGSAAAPDAPPSGDPAASGTPPAGPPGELVTFTCDPGCDEIKVDDQAVDFSKPVSLPAGKHMVVASKADFKTVNDTLNVVAGAGKKNDKTFKLTAVKAAATGPGPGPGPGPVNKPKCSRFVKTNCVK